jgi:Dyp-type peroxidase family
MLERFDLQALVEGLDHRWSAGVHLFCRFGPDTDCRRALSTLLPPTSCSDLDRDPGTVINVGISFQGLQRIVGDRLPLDEFPSEFRQGMHARAAANRDTGCNAPAGWEPAFGRGAVHVWIGLYAQSTASLRERRESLRSALQSAGGIDVLAEIEVGQLTAGPGNPVHIDDPSSNPGHDVSVEHFGFRDGVSNPPVLGLHRTDPKGCGALRADGGWSALAPGEFILGQADEHGETTRYGTLDRFVRNGSFLVCRKLEQDVDAFRDFLLQQSLQQGVSADFLAARMVGRKRDGGALIAGAGLNDFCYRDDPRGQGCPLGAHVRRANPRDQGGRFRTVLADRHRMLRRGIPYGRLVRHGERQSTVNPAGGQGLMFLALVSSISRQFEFVQSHWINDGNDCGHGKNGDPLVGLHGPGARMILPGNATHASMMLRGLPSFVTVKGGEYLFMPSVSMFAWLAANSGAQAAER